jgi:shikimate dehydrogenase
MALVGWPVGHSLSPSLWEGVGRRRGLDVEYARYPVEPGDEDAWEALWASDLHGFNVTAPHKERAAQRCDALSPAAERIGAVNTVIRTGDRWTGHTTDGYGFVRGVLAASEPIRGRSMAVLGTGGAGRSVSRAAAEAGAEVTLVSRFPTRVPQGCEELPRIDWEALATREFDVVVNATPIGRGKASGPPPVPYARCCSGALAVDLNYTPPVTPFLRAARASGARTLNGLATLIYQACLGAALLVEGDAAAAESYEEDFRAVAREVAPRGVG